MSTTTLPGIDFRRTTEEAARYPFLWRARDLSLNAQSGQTGTYTDTVGESADDSFGATMNCKYNQPVWSYNSTYSRMTFRPRASAKSVTWPVPVKPQAMCGIVNLIDVGSSGSTYSAGLWDLSNGAGTGARIFLHTVDSGTLYFELVYTADGITFRRSVMAATVNSGISARIRWQLTSAGVAQAWISLGGDPEVAGSIPSASALPSSWGGTTMSLNWAESVYGASAYTDCVVMMGNQTAAVLAAAIA